MNAGKIIIMLLVTILLALALYSVIIPSITPTQFQTIPGSTNTIKYDTVARDSFYLEAKQSFTLTAISNNYFFITELDRNDSKTLHHAICQDDFCSFQAENLPPDKYFLTEGKGAVNLTITTPPDTIVGKFTYGYILTNTIFVSIIAMVVWAVCFIIIVDKKPD